MKYIYANNGIYAYKGYKDAIHNLKQSLTFCSISTYFQNGNAENRIKIIIPVARIVLINIIYNWPSVATLSLWPFAILAATRNWNKYKLDINSVNAEERLSGICLNKTELLNLKDEHVLFCPCFILIRYLNGIGEWELECMWEN